MNPQSIVQKVWGLANVLKDDGLAFMDYTEQITYLLFLKMVSEDHGARGSVVPPAYSWSALKEIKDDAKLATRYQSALRKFSEMEGLLGLIFAKPQSKINDPAKLRLLIQMIDSEDWGGMGMDVKGAIYEGLLAKNADDVRGGAGQYFTPRPVIQALVEVMRPSAMMKITDPACGTGGFLLAAHDYLKTRVKTSRERVHLATKALHGADIVPNVARLCAMNLFLHGIGTDHKHPAISIGDSLAKEPEPVDMVLTNPPFGKKSSITIISDERAHTQTIFYKRLGFWATTSNKQLNFVQHIYSMLKVGGSAAVVVPDNVLFEGGAGEKVRRGLLQNADVHTVLRLPTGIWYSPGVKANVLFFEKRPATSRAATKDTWVYDLRVGQNFTLRHKPIASDDLKDFVAVYSADDRSKRKETARFRRFRYEDIMQRPHANLDISWAPLVIGINGGKTPKMLMRGILSDLETAMKEFSAAEKQIRQ